MKQDALTPAELQAMLLRVRLEQADSGQLLPVARTLHMLSAQLDDLQAELASWRRHCSHATPLVMADMAMHLRRTGGVR
jgi:hypothetical protein